METLIALNNVRYTIGIKELFNNLSMSISAGDRIGLIGGNGKGKSTLISIINKKIDPEEGEVVYRKGLLVETVEQFIPDHLYDLTVEEAVLEKIPPDFHFIESYKVEIFLEELYFPKNSGGRKIRDLSGGEKNKVMMMRAFINDPDVVLIDEPTNHLDLETMIQLERFLINRFGVTLLFISHDRDFLDHVSQKTFFLRDKGITPINFPYSRALNELKKLDEDLERRREIEEREIERLKKTQKRMAQWGILNEKVAVKAKSFEKRIEKLEKEKTTLTEKNYLSLTLKTKNSKMNGLIHLRPFTLNTLDGKRKLFDLDDFSLWKGDRIALLGQNGVGKTTLLKYFISFLSKENDNGPNGFVHESIKLGYFDQEQAGLSEEISMIDWVMRESCESYQKSVEALVKGGFFTDDHIKKMRILSGGEKARLKFILFRLKEPNFLILDEPTNHLDLQGKIDLERELKNNLMTMIFVSHDRRFVKEVANRYFKIDKGEFKEILDVEKEFYFQI